MRICPAIKLGGSLDMNNQQIHNLSVPSINSNVSTDGYVGSHGQIGSIGSVGLPGIRGNIGATGARGVSGRNYVVVGHAGSGADYICDGMSDEVEILAALTTGREVKIIGGDGIPYNIGNLVLPASSAIRVITAYNPLYPPVLKATTANGDMISGAGRKFDISYIVFDANGKSTQCIDFRGGASNSIIHHNEFYGFVQTSWDWLACAIAGNGADTVDIHSNVIHDYVGMGIWVVGKVDPANLGAYCSISYNHIYAGKPYAGSALSAIYGEHLDIHHNAVHNIGTKTNSYATGSGLGIMAGRSRIYANVVRGCGNSGILPVSYNSVANDAYCLVDLNASQYNQANGIDFWWSDGSIVTNNTCCDNGQNDDVASWDRDGIDVCDHSQNCIVSGNICSNWMGTAIDTLLMAAPAGQMWIAVNNVSRFYNVLNGYNCPLDGLYISIGAATNRIDYVDIAHSRLYLVYPVPSGGYALGATVTGQRKQLIGINIADNGQSLGGHRGTGNDVSGNNTVQIWPTINGTCLPDTNINGYGNV